MDEENKQTIREFQILAICTVVLFVFFILSKIELLNIPNFFKSIIYFRINNYQYINTPLFSLGSMLTGVGLIFTVYQLRNKTWETVLNIRKRFSILLLILLALSVLSTFGSIFFEQIANFLEILSAFLLVIVPFLLVIITAKNNLFSYGKEKRFYEELLKRASLGGDENYKIITDILIKNLRSIFRNIPCRHVEEKELTYKQKYSSAVLLYVLTDKNLAKYIVTNRIDFLGRFLLLIKNKDKELRHIPNFSLEYPILQEVINNLFEQGFNSRNSYFYKDIENIFRKGFLDYFLEGYELQNDLRLLNNFSFPVYKKINFDKAKLLMHCLELILKNYFKQEKEYQSFDDSYVEFIFEEIINLLRTVFWEYKDDRGVLSNEGNKFLSSVSFFHRNFSKIIRDNYDKSKISTDELNLTCEEPEKSFPRIKSFTALYIKFSTDLLSILGNHPDKSRVYFYACEIIMEIYQQNEKFIELFDKLVWTQIKANIDGYFPAILPVYMDVICFWHNQRSEQEKKAYNKLVGFLYEELMPKIKESKLMVNNKDFMKDVLLGYSVKFEDEKFIYVDSVLNKTILEKLEEKNSI